MARAIGLLVSGLLLLVAVEAVASASSVRVGYFANITHAQALYGRSTGLFAQQVGTPIDWKVFNAGPTAMEALLSGALDICYVGPNPAVNAYLRTKGKALRIVAGAANGGAALVLAPHVTVKNSTDLRGKRLASPEFGNTQDVALKSWLKRERLVPGRDVQVLPAKNPDILNLFRQKQIAGAWVPEPWLSRLVSEAGGRIFVDERSLWRDGRFPTAVVVVRTEFLKANPELVRKFLAAHAAVTRSIASSPKEAARVINRELATTTRAALPQSLVEEAFTRLTFTAELPLDALQLSAQHAAELGMLPVRPGDVAAKLRDLADLTLLPPVGKKKP